MDIDTPLSLGYESFGEDALKIISYLISGEGRKLICLKLAFVVACATGVAAVHAKTITIAYAGVSGSPAENGVRQGIIEANVQGRPSGGAAEVR